MMHRTPMHRDAFGQVPSDENLSSKESDKQDQWGPPQYCKHYYI